MDPPSAKPRIHLTAVGSPATSDLGRLGVRSAKDLVALGREAVGDRYRVTAGGCRSFA